MHMSVLDTGSSCRTIGKVTKSVCLVGGAFPVRPPLSEIVRLIVRQGSPVALIPLGRWQDFSSRYATKLKSTSRSKLKASV